MSDLSDKFFASLLAEGDTAEYIRLGDVEAVFTHVPIEAEDFNVVRDFIKEYGKLPELDTFNEYTGKKLKPGKEDAQFYFDMLKQRHIKKSLIKASHEANVFLKDNDPIAAFEKIQEMVNAVTMQRISPDLFDYRESHDMIANSLLEKKLEGFGIRLGWKTIDDKMGGARGGDLISFVGRLGMGKTMMMLYAAHHAWKTQKKVILFVSMEMTPDLIFERLSALDQSIPHNTVKFNEFSNFGGKDRKKIFLKKIRSMENNDKIPPFYVVDGNLTATIDDLKTLVRHLQPDAVYVDGAYLLRTETGYSAAEKIGHVVSALKHSIATKERIPVIASWQLNREATKLKGNNVPGNEHIAGSDDIPRLSSVVMGLFQDETAETEHIREVRIMKGRSGEKGMFSINWDFRGMNFSEVDPILDNEIFNTSKE